MSNEIIRHLKIHFDLSFDMLEKHINNCPDLLWDQKCGGFIFWQQILHCLTGVLFWTRNKNDEFVEPFNEREVYPELEKDPVGRITKEEMHELVKVVKLQKEELFLNKNDKWLLANSILYNRIRNIDIIEGQIRHIQYHVGHCNSALRERNERAVEWIDYFG
jgi:hypothetical protein